MKRVLISVEGQTEEAFVNQVVMPHLSTYNIYPIPVLVTTKKVKSGSQFKGGLTSYQRAKRDICNLLVDTSAVAITTMYDFFRLPQDFPGYEAQPTGRCYDRVNHLEAAFQADIGNLRFRPYLQIHEFEAFLFVDPDITNTYVGGPNQVRRLTEIQSAFHSPEEINDGPDTAPSKRILSFFPSYEKTLHGPLITAAVGLEPIRQVCPHFSEWLEWLEGLGEQKV